MERRRPAIVPPCCGHNNNNLGLSVNVAVKVQAVETSSEESKVEEMNEYGVKPNSSFLGLDESIAQG
jgi:hypothetical protein